MTAWVVNDLLARGECGLTRFEESVPIHLQLLEPLAALASADPQSYPFT